LGLTELHTNQRASVSKSKERLRDLCIKSAVFELMIADSLPVDIALNEKINALVRVVTFVKGEVPEQVRFAKVAQSAEDAFSVMLRILPELLRFCIICLASRIEIVQVSALKTLKFIFETQGCSLD
jgi:hypothetical protein